MSSRSCTVLRRMSMRLLNRRPIVPPHTPTPAVGRHGLFTFTPNNLSSKKVLMSQCNLKCYQVICTADSNTFTELPNIWTSIMFGISTSTKNLVGLCITIMACIKIILLPSFGLYLLCFSRRKYTSNFAVEFTPYLFSLITFSSSTLMSL